MLSSGSRQAAHSFTRFDTGTVPDAKRLEYWNRVNTETFSEISVDPRSDDLCGVLELREYGRLKLARVRSTAVELRGGRRAVTRPASCGLLLHLQDIGCSRNTQLNRSNILRVGDITFCDASRPYVVECREPVELTVMNLPADLVARRFASVDEFVSMHIDGARGVGAILASIIRNFWAHCAEIEADDNDASEVLINSVLDLMSLMLLVRSDGGGNSVASGTHKLYCQMKSHVENRLADPDLSVHSIAEAFDVSPRHVHRVFAEYSATPSLFILDSRLSFAAAQLRDVMSGTSITQIAFDSGFNDCTSFSRAFRRKYGIAPRAFRCERRTA